MKEIKVYEIELADYLENEIEGLSFIVSAKREYVANVLDEYYKEHEEDITKAIERAGYCSFDYQVKEVEVIYI